MAELRGAVAGVREGLNGRLFLGSQDGFDLELFCTGSLFSEPMLRRWRGALIRRGRELANRGIPYVFFVVPDAPSIYPEDLPADLSERFRPPGEIFLEAMGEIEGVTFVYPLNELRQAKGGLEIYQKNDTHWTVYGSYIGYKSLMRALEQFVACRTVPARDLHFTFRRSYGDLGCLMQPEQVQDIPVVHISGAEMQSAIQYEGFARQTATETCFIGEGASSRAIFFRDSFMTDLAPYVARSFSNLLTIGTTTRVLLDAVDDWKADVVVSQVAERKIFYHETDHQLEGYQTLYRTPRDSPSAKRLQQARIMLPSDSAGAFRLIEADLAGFGGQPEQAFSAAQVCEANGDIEAAYALAMSARASRREQPCFAALAGRIALALGRPQEAVELLREAATNGANNGYFQELLAYCLVQNGEPGHALDVIEEALRTIHDHANLWYWASVLHDALNNPQLATERAMAALDLNPEHPQYIDQASKVREMALAG